MSPQLKKKNLEQRQCKEPNNKTQYTTNIFIKIREDIVSLKKEQEVIKINIYRTKNTHF